MINTVSISDLKQNTSNVIKRVKNEGKPVLVMQRSEPAAVIVDPDYYQALEEALENAQDIKAIEDRKNEPITPANEISKKLDLE